MLCASTGSVGPDGIRFTDWVGTVVSFIAWHF
jgi:hypothetical protein